MKDNLDYIELICELSPNLQKHRDVLTALLIDTGFDSFMETDGGINAYMPETDFKNKELLDFDKKFEGFSVKYSVKKIKDEDWNKKWTENYFEPIIFGDKLVVRASFHPKFKNIKKEIVIDPKTAFGTGYHATTYMLIDEILKTDLQNKRVLDMGTGTGILAILSKMRGSGFTVAVDNDVKAVKNTQENIRVNKTPDIEVRPGTMSDIKGETFDIIYENIWKNIVTADMPLLVKSLNDNGILLTSGFYFNEYEDVIEAGEKAGLKFDAVREKDGWAVVKFRLK